MRVRGSSGSRGSAARGSMDQRKAASVLPEPVGATTSAWAPFAMASHAPSWAPVGAGKAPENHSRVAGEKRPSASCPAGAVMRLFSPGPPTFLPRVADGASAVPRAQESDDVGELLLGDRVPQLL